MSVKVKIDAARLRELIKTAPERVGAAVENTARSVEAIAKITAPYETGALKNSIISTGDGLTWEVSDGVEYGIFQELGTSRMAARPFMTPAVESQAGEFVQRIAKALSE